MLQARYRGNQARQQVKETKAATRIQAHVRGNQVRRDLDGDLVGRCKLDPGLKAPRFQKFKLMKINLLST